jgi:hypothetical protein
MRFREILEGIFAHVSLEEQSIIDMIESHENRMVKRSDLDERQKELARKMVSRGVILRQIVDGKIHYIVSSPD